MAVLTVYGASDDLVEAEGIQGADEFYTTKDSWAGVIMAPNGDTAMLYVDYRKNGCWTVALGIYEEGYKLPEWDVKFYTDKKEANDYSVIARIEVPDGTVLNEVPQES